MFLETRLLIKKKKRKTHISYLSLAPLWLCGHWKVIHSPNIRWVSLPIRSHPLHNIFSHSLQLSHSQMLVERARGLMDSENAEVSWTHTHTDSVQALFFGWPLSLSCALSPCNLMLIFTSHAHTGRKTQKSPSTHQNRHPGCPSHLNGFALLPFLFCFPSHTCVYEHTHTHSAPVSADLGVTQWS